MSPLPEHCVPCKGGEEPLAEAEAEALRAEHVPLWNLHHPRLERTWRLDDFAAALHWVNQVGMLAEDEGHHPDIHLTGWNKVGLVLWTHAIDGLHANDFVLARKIDELWSERQ